MSPDILARLQFAITIAFHYIFPILTIGLSWVIFYFATRYVLNRNPLYQQITKFLLHIFAVSFAFGVVSGLTMEIQFGTNFAVYSRFVGDIFGSLLAAEALIAFFLESCFLGVLLYAEKRVSPLVYWFSSLMVACGTTISVFWIVAANSWQQTPAGYILKDQIPKLTNFHAALFNPSTVLRFCHTLTGSLLTAGFFILGISAYYLQRLAKEPLEVSQIPPPTKVKFAETLFKTGALTAFLASLTIFFFGHLHAVQVAKTQAPKLAAFEGLWQTGPEAPLLLFGIPKPEAKTTLYSLKIPKALSILIGGKQQTVIKGLDSFPADLHPPLTLTFLSFHLMILLGFYFLLLSTIAVIFGVYFYLKHQFIYNFPFRCFLKLALYTLPLPFIANEVGWIAAEVGRQPWVVYGLLRTKAAISPNVDSQKIWISLILFSTLYLFLGLLWFYLIKNHLRKYLTPKAN